MTHTHTERGPSRTRYTITGAPREVDRAISRLMQDYPAYGYGTEVVLREFNIHDQGEPACDRAVVTRSNSCD